MLCILLLAPELARAQTEAAPATTPAVADPGPLWLTRTVVRCEAKKLLPNGTPERIDVPRGGKLIHPTRLEALVLAAGTDLPICNDNLAECRARPPVEVVKPTGDSWPVRAGLVGGGVLLGVLAVLLGAAAAGG